MNADNRDVNFELLEEVIYGAKMGMSACQTLLTKTRDADILGSLNAQIEQYGAVKTRNTKCARAALRPTPAVWARRV